MSNQRTRPTILYFRCTFSCFPLAALGVSANAQVGVAPQADNWHYSLMAGAINNSWTEYLAAPGRRVVETAVLPSVDLEMRRETTSAHSSLSLSGLIGTRDYDGWSSIGQKVTSTSDISRPSLSFSQLWKLDQSYSLGVGLTAHYLRRRINGTAQAQGYTEYFHRQTLRLGGQKIWNFIEGDSLQLRGWVGWGDGGELNLQIPSFDKSRLELGAEKTAELSLTWFSTRRAVGNSSYRIKNRLLYAVTETGVSATTALTRSGVTVGSISQPRTIERDWGVMIGFERTW